MVTPLKLDDDGGGMMLLSARAAGRGALSNWWELLFDCLLWSVDVVCTVNSLSADGFAREVALGGYMGGALSIILSMVALTVWPISLLSPLAFATLAIQANCSTDTTS